MHTLLIFSIVSIFFFYGALAEPITSEYTAGGQCDPNLLHFESARLNQKQFLIDFAIQSNDIYQTRTSNRNVAEKVFDIDQAMFLQGVVELLTYNNEIVGFFTLNIEQETNTHVGALEHLFVKAGLQKQGFGTLLFNKAVRIAQSKGCNKLIWISDPDAQEFYLKRGARIIGYKENLLNPTVDVPVFTLDLV